jgi:hypothetical protein
MRQLVIIHGRAQERMDSIALKKSWIDAWQRGLAKSNLQIPLADADIRFPYYGDTLINLVEGGPAVDVIVRGVPGDAAERQFMREVLREVQEQAGLTDDQIDDTDQDFIERGIENAEWVHRILRAIDKYVPGASGAGVALATRDVYQYLNDENIRHVVETGVAQAIKPGVETVVVSHSLGTVVAYNLLRREGVGLGWKVPLFMTLGSPLGIETIRSKLRSLLSPLRCPECAGAWFNAMDPRDVVALYPLRPNRFPLDPRRPEIVNHTGVDNHTENRHGIEGYLDDKEVAARIYHALMAT